MCRMLIDQDESVGVLHQDIQLVEDADDLELLSITIALNRSWRWRLMRLDSSAGVDDPGYS